MKKTMLSLSLAVLVMAGAHAQQDATERVIQDMDASGVQTRIIELTDSNGKPKQAFNPSRSTNNGPVAQRTTKAVASNDCGTPKNPTTTIKGVEYFITSDGPHLPGDVFPLNDPQFVVDDCGNELPFGQKSQPVPNPANNTGTATAGLTVVSPAPKLDDMYDVLADGRVVSAGPVRVEPAGGASTASTTGGGAPAGLFELDPTKNYYYTDPATGAPTLVEKPLMVMTTKKNQAITNGKDLKAAERAREEHRMDDNFGLGLDPDEEHMPDPRVVAADHSGDMFTSWQSGGGGGLFSGGGGFVSTGVVVSGANCAPGYNATALYGNGSCAPIQGGLSVGPHWNRR